MNTGKHSGRIIGALLLLQLVLGILINQYLLGPLTFASDFLTQISLHTTQVGIGVLMSLIAGAISIGIAVMLLPRFQNQNPGLSLWYLGFTIISFAVTVLDNISVLSLLSLSREYLAVGAEASSAYFETLGALTKGTRYWAHIMNLFVAGFSLSAFFYLFYVSKLVARFISVLGIIGVASMLAAVLLLFFGQPMSMLLYLPLAVATLLLALALLIKGFPLSYSDSKGTLNHGN
ncbi:MAG: DUF4386 domain-containing protein [Saonia sp.]